MAHLPLRDPDDDLIPVLRQASSEDLGILVRYLHAAFNQELSTVPAFQTQNPKADSKEYDGDHRLYADDIAAEIQRYGGNSFSNVLRGGKGVPYIEVLCDVAANLKVNFNKNSDAATIEGQIQLKVLEGAYDKMTEEERTKLLDELGVNIKNGIPKALPVIALQTAIRMSGFLPFKLAAIVANAIAKALIGRGLGFVATGTMMRTISVFAGPIGWAITGLWTAVDIAGPAYRLTIPCVLQVAYMRQKEQLTICEACGAPQAGTAKFCASCGAEMKI